MKLAPGKQYTFYHKRKGKVAVVFQGIVPGDSSDPQLYHCLIDTTIRPDLALAKGTTQRGWNARPSLIVRIEEGYAPRLAGNVPLAHATPTLLQRAVKRFNNFIRGN